MRTLTITQPLTERAKKLIAEHGDTYLLEGDVQGVFMIHALGDDDDWFGWINRREADIKIEEDDL
jgi:hypothetical protein